MTMLPMPTTMLEIPAQPFLALRRRIRQEWRTITRGVSHAAKAREARTARRAALRERQARDRKRMEMFIRNCAADGRITVREFF